jgi:hypothetical protein
MLSVPFFYFPFRILCRGTTHVFFFGSTKDVDGNWYIQLQVKTRMQLVHGKSSIGLVGSFKDIIRQEGCVHNFLNSHSRH